MLFVYVEGDQFWLLLNLDCANLRGDTHASDIWLRSSSFGRNSIKRSPACFDFKRGVMKSG